jgi:hypothetical protein
MKMDLEAVKRWASINYPYLIGNEDAIVKLYKKNVLGETIIEKSKYVAPYKTIERLEDRIPATIAVTKIARVRGTSKEVCGICGKKTCTEHRERVMKYSGVYQVADQTGIVEIFMFDTKEFVEGIEKNEFFLLSGRVEKSSSFSSFIVRSYEVITKEMLNAFYNTIDFFTISSSGGTISEEKYEKYISTNGYGTMLRPLEKYYIAKKEEGIISLNLGN